MASSLAEAAQGQYPAEEVTELEERDEENAEQEDYTDDEGEGEGEEGIPIANLKAARPPAFRCHSISSNGAQPFKFRVSLTRSSRRAGRPRWAILPRLNSECIAPRTFVRIGSFVNIVSIVDGARQVDPALVLEMRELEGMTWLHIAWTYDIDERTCFRRTRKLWLWRPSLASAQGKWWSPTGSSPSQAAPAAASPHAGLTVLAATSALLSANTTNCRAASERKEAHPVVVWWCGCCGVFTLLRRLAVWQMTEGCSCGRCGGDKISRESMLRLRYRVYDNSFLFPIKSPGGPYLPLPSQRQKAFQNQTEMRTREFCSKWLHDSCLAKNAVIEHANHRLPKGRDSSEAPLDLITY
ncbi:hypothetical protein BU26DRAFT_135813 [Trematosphaeria pertusa]|uniref:Uncharacterized protein n=1 Tax=Trematosphaeria pertusa TaxID=390896 RepID=A0A6A6IV14_9PLEO|nr:uncharacterized protein BU26DRAFT_135813 [Trematosphaeria pertusa]KAF2254284.1 hypothetical protein BU26DRAFT_135813 [Trematosphaeria pertusa]